MSQSTICLDTELRKLKLRDLYTLGQILNLSDSWKKLMAIVPKEDTPDLPKFTSEHFSIIEQAAQQQKRNAAEIFLSEWGTMGKKRPTVHTLLNLLVKAELFRAADYVAGDILKEELPKRPKHGPAAPVDISDESIKTLLEEQKELQEIECDDIFEFQLPCKTNDNKEINSNGMGKEMNNSSLERNMQSTKLVSIKEKQNVEKFNHIKDIDIQQKPIEVSLNVDVSDLMKFSTEQNMESVLPSNILNTKNFQQHVFENQELSSHELPIFLHEFRQPAEQVKFNREMLSNELPIFLHDRKNSSHNIFSSNQTNKIQLSNLNINEYKIMSTELPQCVVELQRNSTTKLDDTVDIKDDQDVHENTLCSQELPVTVLEYNQSNNNS